MKNSSILILGTLFNIAFSQTMTNGSLYNYNVGDTIVTLTQSNTVNGHSVPPVSYYKIITSRTMSAAQDSIYYTEDVFSYTPPGCATCTPVYANNSLSFFVTDLNASATNFAIIFPGDTICLAVIDKDTIQYCGKKVHRKYTERRLSGNCFEPPTYRYEMIEGVGKLYSFTLWNSNPPGVGSSETLVAYHKAGGSCGSIGVVPTGIKEVSGDGNLFEIFPNPSEGAITIKKTKDNLALQIYSQAGELVKEINVRENYCTLDLQLDAGLYFIVSRNQEGVLYWHRLILTGH